MIGISLQLVNLSEVIQGHDRFIAANERAIQQTSEEGGTAALNHVQNYNTFQRRTGKLQDKTDYRIVKTASGKILRLQNNLPYANAIDGGARPHVIRPRRAKFLRFYSKKAGKWVFARRVNHPGNKPYKFAYRAINAAYRVMGQTYQRRFADLARKF